MRIALSLLAATLLCPPASLLAGDEHGEHSHGVPDLGNIGSAHLDTSCEVAAQQEIDRGVTLIHSFWYREAEQSFLRAVEADDGCGMGWWGVAMSHLHPLWAPPTPDELQAGSEAAAKATHVGASTQRERAFIRAIATFYADANELSHATRMQAYEKAMAEVARANPDDDEAAIFHALALLGTASPTDKSYIRQKQAAEILNRVLPERPDHPGIAHYLIHSFDYPELAQLALPAARVYAKLAPGSPHALHMPSHIFTRLGLWSESIDSNLASAEKARRYTEATSPGATAFDELHARDYLVYAYLQEGDVESAGKLVRSTAAVTRIDHGNHFAAAFAIAAIPARFALERGAWEEAASLTVPATIEWSKVPYAEANIHFARGIGAARSGEIRLAQEAGTRLASIRQSLIDQENVYWADQVEIQRLSVAAWTAHASGQIDDALTLMRKAADLEAVTGKHPVTPGAIVPAREQLAEMLLETRDRKAALAEIERVLRDAPNRRNASAIAARAR